MLTVVFSTFLLGFMFPLLWVSLFTCTGGVRMTSRTNLQSATRSAYCMGSGQSCNGNECCPGYESTWGKTFPCPEADPSFYDQCESPSRFDLYEASRYDFGNVAIKNLTGAEGAEFLMTEVSWYNGVSRDMLIHALDDDGERIPLTDETILKFVSAYRGKLLSIALLSGKSVNLRFYIGHMIDGVWTLECIDFHGCGCWIKHTNQ